MSEEDQTVIGCLKCRRCRDFSPVGPKATCRKLERPIKFIVDGPCPCEEGK